MQCAGVVLCLVMLLCSDDNLLRLYSVVLPGMAAILTHFVVTQRFLESTCCTQSPPSQPPPTTDLWSQLVSYLSEIVQYFAGKDNTAAAEVKDVSCDCYHKILFLVSLISQLALSSFLLNFITVLSSKVERIILTVFIYLIVVPCSLKLVGASKSDVDFANTVVCKLVCWGMEIWSSVCLERMLYTSVRYITQNDLGLGWFLVELWHRARCPLCVSWLVAYSAQFVDSLQAADVSDLTYTEVMLFNLRHRSWTPMMYLGLCSVVGYLTDIVWKLVYLVVARSAARQDVTDNGLSEVLTLIHARVVCFLLGISTADMFSFAIPFLVGLLAVRWIFRAVKALLLSDDRRARIGACVVYLATSIALPSLVFFRLTNEKHVYLAGNLFIALRFSIRGASTLIQSFVKQWYSAADVGDADDVNLIVKVSTGKYRR